MRKPLPLFILLISLASSTLTLHAQNQSLRLARSVYEQGRLQEIPSILTDDLIQKLSTSEKVEAYKLLCLTNIYLEEPELADNYMLKILQTDHEFVLNRDTEPAEFVALYETFRHKPIYRFGAILGANATQPNVVGAVNSVNNLLEGSEYKFLIGLQFGFSADLPLTDHLTLHGNLSYVQKRYQLDLIVDRGIDPNTGTTLRNSFTGIETNNWVSLPITIQYKIGQTRFNLFISAGVSTDYLLTDELVGERLLDGFSPVEEKTYDMRNNRNSFNLSAVVGGGIKLKLGKGFLVGEVYYNYGITELSKEETSLSNSELIFGQGYADPVYKLNSLFITGSYLINIYNPKKLTNRK